MEKEPGGTARQRGGRSSAGSRPSGARSAMKSRSTRPTARRSGPMTAWLATGSTRRDDFTPESGRPAVLTPERMAQLSAPNTVDARPCPWVPRGARPPGRRRRSSGAVSRCRAQSGPPVRSAPQAADGDGAPLRHPTGPWSAVPAPSPRLARRGQHPDHRRHRGRRGGLRLGAAPTRPEDHQRHGHGHEPDGGMQRHGGPHRHDHHQRPRRAHHLPVGPRRGGGQGC